MEVHKLLCATQITDCIVFLNLHKGNCIEQQNVGDGNMARMFTSKVGTGKHSPSTLTVCEHRASMM